jgi:hypothetical protein
LDIFLVKVLKLDPVTQIEELADFPSMTKVTIRVGGEEKVIDGSFFREGTREEWELAVGFSQLKWSRAKQDRWCDKLFRGRTYKQWNNIEKKRAIAMLHKLKRRILKIESLFQHPLSKK